MALTMILTTMPLIFSILLSMMELLQFSFLLYLNIKKETIKIPKESKKSFKKLQGIKKMLKESKTKLRGSKKH